MIGEELRQGYLATIQALALAIELKDPYTNAHSTRVSRYSVALAKKMGLEESETDRIESAAILHDIGKIAVPYDILHKPGPLNAQENLVLRKHPEYGSQLLSFLRNYDVERETVRHHHEWFDGRGYPDGLRGEQLTLCTRIVAVADVYDALTTFRSYRVPQDRHSAFLEIEACSGTQFDPDVVEAMRSLMREDVWPVFVGVEEEVASTF
jgi:HD-GYP domain-containing protein (c-di-GMP phosphodiesterase class II)